MKTSLPIVGEVDDREPSPPHFVSVGAELIAVADAHLGREAADLAEQLVDAGARRVDGEPTPTLRIVVRSTPRSEEARIRADALERDANVVLGSARPAFAEALVLRFRSPANL